MNKEHIGRYAFFLGLIVSVVFGLASVAGLTGSWSAWVWALLVVLGIVVGLVNVTAKETHGFLLGSVALLVVGIGLNAGAATLIALNPIVGIGTWLQGILVSFLAFVSGATLILAFKEVWALSEGI